MQNNFENINDETPFIPFDDVWTSLKPELDKEAARREKRKRRFIFFWFTFIAISLLAGGGLLIVKSEELKVKSDKLNNLSKTPNSISKTPNSIPEIPNSIPKSPNSIPETPNSIPEIPNSIPETPNSIPESLNSIPETPNSIPETPNSIAKTSSKEQENSKINTGTSNIDKRTSNIEVRISSNDKRTSSVDTRTSRIDTRTSNTDTRVVENIFENLQQNKSVDNENQTVKTKQQENNITNNAKPQTPNKEKQQKQTKNFSYGLQWNLPLQNGLQYNDINADNKPLLLLIPQFWVSKQFGKHSLMLGFNPYSQYFVSNKAVASTSNYVVTFYSGSQVDNKPQEIRYTEAVLFNKLIAVEASLTYQYQLSSKIKIGAGIGNNWVQGALLKNRVIKNNTTITRDSLYGIDKKDAEWSYIKQTFLLGKIELQYQIKKLDIGVSFSKPLGNMFNNIEESRTPVNTNLFVRWKLK